MTVRVQTADFDLSTEVAALRAGNPAIGAVVSFVGVVRDMNEGQDVSTMELEHYPGMTEKALEDIVAQAHARWDLLDSLVIHRVGPLLPLDQIVLVVVASRHRGEAFAACEFIMDYLKTEAPFWKKEQTAQGARWVDARETDDQALAKWGIASGNAAPAGEGKA
ncbi:MAG: molybdopterin synthase catalytic subunit MoaE [Burkholderiales bacterium]|nr:molybdopterin synthase catalytic subunit MoaE [Burkholderiales bacterium]